MSTLAPLPPLSLARLRLAALAAALLALGGVGAVLVAQVSGERGIAPVASTTDIEVLGIEVETTGATSEEARIAGWQAAQRLAWERIGGPAMSDDRLDELVSAIVVESEQIGPRRYIATLGVVFDRTRAGELLGGGGERSRSAPMLTLPVLMTGGTQTMFEIRNPWQRAWAEFQTGASAIDYVRPSGAGWQSLLLTYGQTGRRSRAWWNDILGQFGASDVLMPVASLRWDWPGGPVEGHFVARHGPDNRVLDEFTLRAASANELPAMLSEAVQRFDAIYTRALAQGRLRPDPTLTLEEVQLSPEIRALIEASRQAELDEALTRARAAQAPVPAPAPPPAEAPAETVAVATFTVQVATPDAASIDSALASVRDTPGVRGTATSSIAIGGTSVLRVTYAGDLAGLAAALGERGWQVTQGTNALAITR